LKFDKNSGCFAEADMCTFYDHFFFSLFFSFSSSFFPSSSSFFSLFFFFFFFFLLEMFHTNFAEKIKNTFYIQ